MWSGGEGDWVVVVVVTRRAVERNRRRVSKDGIVGGDDV